MFGTSLSTEPSWLEWAFRFGVPLAIWPILPLLLFWLYIRTWAAWWIVSALFAAIAWLLAAWGFFGWPLYARLGWPRGASS